MYTTRILTVGFGLVLVACANTTAIQLAASSKSQFEGAVYSGETVTLDKPTPGAESYRLFQQGATGFVSLQSVRSGVEELASGHCERKGKAMHGLVETHAKPPYVLGNFPRVELVFECIDRSSTAAAPTTDTDRYAKLAKVKKLLDDGTLTQQEFEQEKAKILAAPQ
jgi:hypothetical protein